VFESHLRGEWAVSSLEVNAAGEVQRVPGRASKGPMPGKESHLTPGSGTERAAEKALDGVKKGAIVGRWIPQTPEPSWRWPVARTLNPNFLEGCRRTAEWNELNRPEAPMLKPGAAGLSARQHLQGDHGPWAAAESGASTPTPRFSPQVFLL